MAQCVKCGKKGLFVKVNFEVVYCGIFYKI